MSAPQQDATRREVLLQAADFAAGLSVALRAFAEAQPAQTALLKYQAAAAQLACNRTTVARLADRGELKKVLVGSGGPRVTQESVTALIARGGVAAIPRRRKQTLLRRVMEGRS